MSRLALLLCSLLCTSTVFSCVFPNTQARVEAPAWVCEPSAEGYSYAAVGFKGQMPSVTLQRKLAGRRAMAAVALNIHRQAQQQLRQAIDVEFEFDPTPSEKELLNSVEGIKVIARKSDSRRGLYVLAGLPESKVSEALKSVSQQLFHQHAQRLRERLGIEKYRNLRETLFKSTLAS